MTVLNILYRNTYENPLTAAFRGGPTWLLKPANYSV